MYHNQLVHKLAVEQAVTSLASRSISRAYCHRTPNAQAVLVFQKQEYLDAFSWHLKQSKLSSRVPHSWTSNRNACSDGSVAVAHATLFK